MRTYVWKILFILFFSFCNICNAADSQEHNAFTICKNNIVKSLNDFTEGLFILNDAPYKLKVWNNESDNQLRFVDSQGYLGFSDISVVGQGIIWTGIYQENKNSFPSQGIFFRSKDKVQHVYKSSGGKLIVSDNSVIALTYKSEMHSSSGEVVFLELNNGVLPRIQVISAIFIKEVQIYY